jgi:uncharacterized membrane protein
MNCKYKSVFGEPNEGVHRYRTLGFATIDVIFTIIGAYLISRFFGISLFYALVGLFALGVFLHWYFCVNTAFSRLFR